tara:strand:+ start:329 stop:931 length:603 start_codon:yes stop_codon:yes gene_type:complete
MIKRVLNLPTNDSKIYKQILAFLNFSLEASEQEREVLAEIIRLNNDYDVLAPEKRAKFILSTEMRKEMCEILNIKDTQFNVVLSRVRTKKIFGESVLDKNNILNKHLVFKPDLEGLQFIINLKNTPDVPKKSTNIKKKKLDVVEDDKKAHILPEEDPVGIQKTPDPMASSKKLAPPSNGLSTVIEDDSNNGFMLLPPTDG